MQSSLINYLVDIAAEISVMIINWHTRLPREPSFWQHNSKSNQGSDPFLGYSRIMDWPWQSSDGNCHWRYIASDAA